VNDQSDIRITLMTDDHLLREGLELLIEATEGFRLVGSWCDAQTGLHEIPEAAPDVLVLDIKLPHGSAFELLKALPKVSHALRTLVTVECREESCYVLSPGVLGGLARSRAGLTSQLTRPDDCLQLALKMGASGVIRRQCSYDQLAQAIRDIHAGQTVIEPATARRLAEQYLVSFRHTAVEPETDAEKLTLRERQIVQLISQGRSNKEISREMQIAYSTVKNYVSSILEKLDLQDRTQIALYAISSNGKQHEALLTRADQAPTHS
jgi:Response regulator containing a CheY-like receiver domain and an HTH DNA-binding domain